MLLLNGLPAQPGSAQGGGIVPQLWQVGRRPDGLFLIAPVPTLACRLTSACQRDRQQRKGHNQQIKRVRIQHIHHHC